MFTNQMKRASEHDKILTDHFKHPCIADSCDNHVTGKYDIEINVVCCVGRVEIQIEIQKGWCTANTDIYYPYWQYTDLFIIGFKTGLSQTTSSSTQFYFSDQYMAPNMQILNFPFATLPYLTSLLRYLFNI